MDERPNGTYWTRKRALVEHALASMTGTAAKVMHFLEQRADAGSGVLAQIGTQELGDAVGCDRKSARAALAELEAAGCLEQELPEPGRGHKRRVRILVPRGVAPAPLFDGADGPRSMPERGGDLPPFQSDKGGVKCPAKWGESPPFNGERGGKMPRKMGQNTPRYSTPSPSYSPTPGPAEPPTPPTTSLPTTAPTTTERGEADGMKRRVALLVQRGIFPEQARRYAKKFSDRELAQHWHEINSNPRIRKKGGAYANRLKQFLPE